MELVRITPQNVANYIGCDIMFKTRGCNVIKKILGVSNTYVKIDHPDLDNSLEIVSRKVYAIIDS